MDERDDRKKSVTIRDIADAAGVSHAAVSVVLNDKRGGRIRVSEETRERILRAASELGYVPNQAARSLKGARKYLIAVFTYEKLFPVDYRNEFYQFFAGIEVEAERCGYDLLILNNRPEHTTVHDSAFTRIYMADGAVMIGVDRNDREIGNLIRNDFPVVFIGRRELPGLRTNFVTFDYRGAIEGVLRSLAARGARRLRYVRGGGPQREPQRDRERFVEELWASSGFSDYRLSVCGGPAPSLADFGVEGPEDALVFDHLGTAKAALGSASLPRFGDGSPVLSAVLEDDWLGEFSAWPRFGSGRLLLGQAAVRALMRLLDEGPLAEPIQRTYPLDVVEE